MEQTPDGQSMVLLAGDEPQALEQTRLLFQDVGISPVMVLADSCATLPFLEQNSVSMIVLDMTAAMGKTELVARIHADYPLLPIVILSGSSDVDIAVNCMKCGAAEYMVKPIEPGRLVAAARNALNSDCRQHEVSSRKENLLNGCLEHAEAFAEIKTACRKIQTIFKYTEVVAVSSQAVLITGETGVGKELFARAIHRISGVRGMFVSINVAGLDDAMFSDTLFGHKRGAFTGADQFREGLVSKASNGTLFLDEIGDLNELSQVKLLRLLQEQEYYPVGADLVKISSARIVLATNVNLQERIKEGRFRRDLFYRLCFHQIHIPALRERREDIPVLLDSFIDEAARHFGRSAPLVSPELIAALKEYDFPGNVRELQVRVNDAVARHEDGILTLDDFNGILASDSMPPPDAVAVPAAATAGIYSLFGRLPTFREIEDYLIVEALKISEGNFAIAAALLGVTRQTISKRLKSIESDS